MSPENLVGILGSPVFAEIQADRNGIERVAQVLLAEREPHLAQGQALAGAERPEQDHCLSVQNPFEHVSEARLGLRVEIDQRWLDELVIRHGRRVRHRVACRAEGGILAKGQVLPAVEEALPELLECKEVNPFAASVAYVRPFGLLLEDHPLLDGVASVLFDVASNAQALDVLLDLVQLGAGSCHDQMHDVTIPGDAINLDLPLPLRVRLRFAFAGWKLK